MNRNSATKAEFAAILKRLTQMRDELDAAIDQVQKQAENPTAPRKSQKKIKNGEPDAGA